MQQSVYTACFCLWWVEFTNIRLPSAWDPAWSGRNCQSHLHLDELRHSVPAASRSRSQLAGKPAGEKLGCFLQRYPHIIQNSTMFALTHMDIYGCLWHTYGCGDATFAQTFIYPTNWDMLLTSNSWLLWSTMLRASFSLWETDISDIHISSTWEHYRLPDISMTIYPLAYQITASFVVTVDIVTICVRHQLQVPETVHSSGPWS